MLFHTLHNEMTFPARLYRHVLSADVLSGQNSGGMTSSTLYRCKASELECHV